METTNETPMTIGEMETLLRNDVGRLDDAARDVEEQLKAWEYGRTTRDWGGPNGEGLEEIRAGYLAKIDPKVTDAERRAEAAAHAAVRNAMRVRQAIGDDRIALPDAEKAEASARLPLVQHEAASLPLAQLAAEVRAAVARGDKVAAYLYARTVPARLAEAPTAEGGRIAPRDEEAAGELGRLLSRIQDDLRDRSMDALKARTDAVLEHAERVRSAARKRGKANDAPIYTLDGRMKVRFPQAS